MIHMITHRKVLDLYDEWVYEILTPISGVSINELNFSGGKRHVNFLINTDNLWNL